MKTIKKLIANIQKRRWLKDEEGGRHYYIKKHVKDICWM